MNNDLITKYFPHKTKDEDNHVNPLLEQGSSEKQRPPPSPTPITPPNNKEDFPVPQTHVPSSAISLNTGSAEQISLQQSNSSLRDVFLSLVVTLDTHKSNPMPSQSLQEDRKEAHSHGETTTADQGVQLWQEFCARRAYEDDYKVTPEKLLEYIDLICLPYDNIQQDATNRDQSYPQLVLSLKVLVRPVLQLWVQKASTSNADYTFTEEKTAVGEGWEHWELDNYDSMDFQFDYEPETSRDVFTANRTDELGDHQDGDWSARNVNGPENVSRLEPTKKEQALLDSLSKHAATNPIERTSTPLSLAWRPGRYKADEFETPLINDSPTIDIDTPDNVVDILEEWRFGLNGTQAIQDLNRQFGACWRRKDQDSRYRIRSTVVHEFKRLVVEEGMDDDKAVQLLVEKQGPKAISALYQRLCKERATRRRSSEKGKAVSERDPSTSRIPLDPSSSSSDTARASIPSTALSPSTPKKASDMKQRTLWGFISPTPNNALAENPPVFGSTGGPSAQYTGHKTNELQYCDLTSDPDTSEVQESVSLDNTYRFPIFDDIVTVEDLWEFWTQGWQGGLSVRKRIAEHGAAWSELANVPDTFQWYELRHTIVKKIEELVVRRGWKEAEATEEIEKLRLREKLSLEGLARYMSSLKDVRTAIFNSDNANAAYYSYLESMNLARSADVPQGESSRSKPRMGYVGGQYTPGTQSQSNEVLQPDTNSVEPELNSGMRSSSSLAEYSGNTGTVVSKTERKRKSVPMRKRRSRSPSGSPGPTARRSSSSISVSSVTLTGYVTGHRHPRMAVKKE
ncbi:hypothetical protein EC991_004097 [Linnemannia zychae]|nr:hypothetical protein EC991_004097 [Linnemannia zychae]